MNETKTFEVSPETCVEIRNEMPEPMGVCIECGDYGMVRATLPIGVAIQITVGTLAPRIHVMKSSSDDSEGDNVIRFDQRD